MTLHNWVGRLVPIGTILVLLAGTCSGQNWASDDRPTTRMQTIGPTRMQEVSAVASHVDMSGSVVRVVADRGYELDIGTGVYIGSKYVLSAKHVTEGGGQVRVEFAGGKQRMAVVEACHNTKCDQVLLILKEALPLRAARLREEPLRLNEPIHLCGLSWGSNYGIQAGRVVNPQFNGR